MRTFNFAGYARERRTLSVASSRRRTCMIGILCGWMAFGAAGAAFAEELPKLVLYGMELQDVSHEGERDGIREDQQRRLALLDAEARRLFSETGFFELTDVSSAAEEIERLSPLRRCNGCDVDIARRFGADYAALGVVYKVSNLILEIHLYLRDVDTGKVVNHMHTNIRGNTDKSWLRGLRWLVKNRLKAPA